MTNQKINSEPGEALRYDAPVDLSNENSSHTQLVLLTGENKKVLEIGPATGFVTRALNERKCQITVVEIDPVAAEAAARFSEKAIVGDVETIDLMKELGPESFDAILLGDVLEHLVDPEGLLVKLRTFLADSGELIVSIPNVAHGSVRLSLLGGDFPYQETGLLDRTHLRFFTKTSIATMFQNSGYKIQSWHNVILSPFDTELGLKEANYPAFLVDSIRKDRDSEIFQYIFRATLDPGVPGKHLPKKRKRRTVRPTVKRLLEAERAFQASAEAASYWKKEAEEVRGLLEDNRQQLDNLNLSLAQADSLIAQRTSELNETRQELTARLDRLQGDLDLIRSAAGFRILSAYRSQVHRFLPPGTKRAHGYHLALSTVKRAVRKIYPGNGSATQAAEKEPLIEEPEPDQYPIWLAGHQLAETELQQQRVASRSKAFCPLISLILPCWDADPENLSKTVESVLAQTYPNWEMCIADGNSSEETKLRLQHLAAADDRINVIYLEENRGISGNSNAAIEAARGAYLGFIDQSDLLEPDALYEVVRALNEDPAIEIVHSDFDLVEPEGNHFFNPVFTPECSPETLLSSNYMAHFLLLKAELVKSLGGLRGEMDGAQDWDLLLRADPVNRNIHRIPRILYHWRADPTSAAMSLETKSYAALAQENALKDYVESRGWKADIERRADLHLRLRWKTAGTTMVSIIIPTRNNQNLLHNCLAGIEKSTYQNREIVVVETADRTPSLEASYQRLAEEFDFRLLWWRKPFNYSAVNNWAASQTSGDALLFLNDDTLGLSPDWLEELVGWIEADGIAAVGPQLTAPDGTITHSGVVVGLKGFADHLFQGMKQGDWSLMGSTTWYRNVSAVTGACLMVSRKIFDEVGGWNDEFILCGSDVELCLRIQQTGGRIVCTPFSNVEHAEGSTRKGAVPKEDFFTSYWYYQSRLFGGDPYFNPNLSYRNTVPQLRDPAEPTPVEMVSEIIGRELAPGQAKDPSVEALELVGICEINEKQVTQTLKLHSSLKGSHKPESINWFIPDFVSPFFGGIFTVLRFARYLQSHHGVRNRFVVAGSGPEGYIRSGLRRAFPELGESDVVIAGPADVDDLPYADASVATLWITAYMLSRFHATKRKFYFIQDFEPMFYAAGTTYSLAEHTYRMGLYGIANSPTMKSIYERDYGGKAVGFNPAVDTCLFYSDNESRKTLPYTVFLYGRPGTSRNCYEVAIRALEKVKQKLGDQVRIVAAGSWQQIRAMDPKGILTPVGLMDYEATAALYRQCHLGLVLSSSKHPSYLPLELMASGCLVVSNLSDATGWLLKNEVNCLLTAPTATSVSETIVRGLEDEQLRKRLTAAALDDISRHYADWDAPMEKIWDFLCDPEKSRK